MAADREKVRRMAELLKSGATMLSMTCPSCHSPLFRLRTGETVCPICGTRFLIARDESETVTMMVRTVIEDIERTASERLRSISLGLRGTGGDDELRELDRLVKWLDVLERVERIKQQLMESMSTGE